MAKQDCVTKRPLRQRAIKFATNRQTPFTTDDLVRVLYGVQSIGDLSARALHHHRKNAVRIIRMVRPELAALYGGKWFIYNRTTCKWRARALEGAREQHARSDRSASQDNRKA